MADSKTTYLQLTLPLVNIEDPVKSWGEKINDNLVLIDTTIGNGAVTKLTYAAIVALTKVEGNWYYATDQKQMYLWDGVSLQPK